MLKRKIYENRHFITVLLFFTTFMLIYLSMATTNIPMSDFWSYLVNLGEKAFTNGLSFRDLYGNNYEHHSPVSLGLFIINVKAFKMNMQLPNYAGAILFAVVAVMLYAKYKKNFSTMPNQPLYWIGMVLLVASCFTLSGWELLTLGFHFDIALRILVFLGSFFIVEAFLLRTEQNAKYALEIAAFLMLVITCLSGGFFLGLGFSLTIVIIWDYLRKNKGEKMKYLAAYITIGAGMLMGLYIYLSDFTIGQNAWREGEGFFARFFGFGRALLLAFGAALIGAENEYSASYYYIAGAAALAVQALCLFIYFKGKQYRQSYFPMFIILYVFSLILEIYVGRSSQFSIDVMTSSRYTMDTRLLIVADLWIVARMFMNTDRKEKKTKIREIIACCALIGTLGVLMAGNMVEYRIGPYRKEYCDNLIPVIQNIDEATDEELSLFASTPGTVREGVKIMKKYDLGIFQYMKDE